MKILKWTGVVVGVLFVAFLSLGVFIPTVNYSSSITVSATPEKCWNVFHDTSRMERWTEGFKSLRLIQGDSLTPGATYELIIIQDETMVMTEKVLEVMKHKRVVYELINEVLRSECRYEFTPHNNSTQITSTFAVTGNNLFWRSLFVVMKSYFQKGNTKQLDGLKKEIESNLSS